MDWIVELRVEKGGEALTSPLVVEAEDRWGAVVAAVEGQGWSHLATMQDWFNTASVKKADKKRFREYRKEG